ncbi:DMT family transporter [uncultured Azohydromonas sp.]|jgi:EamA-like transporter family.|uniref:DMT family transporter n=1 Tax=uncultured Azohydromonas sp. TaxID=487342 RepID=UPI00262C49AE|nr:DMT family transporter [uncultured Azohydromonas sp.]
MSESLTQAVPAAVTAAPAGEEARKRWTGLLALLLATSAWGGLFHAGKQVLTRLDPFWFTALRYGGAALLLAALLLARGALRPGELRAQAGRLFGLGLLGYGAFGILVFIGLSMSVPSHGAVIMATMPLSTLFMRWAIDGQRPQWWAWIAASLALGGVSLVAGVWSAPGAGSGGSTLAGDSIALLGTLGWILYTRGQAKVPQLSVLEYTAYTALLAFPGLLAIAALASGLGWAHRPSVEAVREVAPAALYIIAIGTVLAALAYNLGVRLLGVTTGVLFINWVPVSALVIGAVLGHVPSASELIGTGLVIAALVLVAGRMRAAGKG